MIISVFIIGLSLSVYLVYRHFENKKKFWWNK